MCPSSHSSQSLTSLRRSHWSLLGSVRAMVRSARTSCAVILSSAWDVGSSTVSQIGL